MEALLLARYFEDLSNLSCSSNTFMGLLHATLQSKCSEVSLVGVLVQSYQQLVTWRL